MHLRASQAMHLRASRRLAAALIGSVTLVAACGPGGSAADGPAPRSEDAVYAVRATSCSTGQEHRAVAVAMTDRLVVTVAHVFTDTGRFVLSPAAAPDDPDPTGTATGDVPSTGRSTSPAVAARLVSVDTERDLAVISLDEPAAVALPTAAPVTGETVEVITVDDGPVRRAVTVLRQVDVTVDGAGRRRGLELDGVIELGDSGSPLVDGDGSMVGMVFAEARGAERGWAVSSAELDGLVADTEPDGPSIVLACR
ncbi:MAG: serine protease [Acidimicrobiales bacterium]